MNKPLFPALWLASLILFAPLSNAEDTSNWADRIDFRGDIRLRYEGIDEDFEDERNRMRFRTRFGFTAAVQDDLNVILQLATGGDNPVSTNQTFDDGFSRKDIRLALAYVDWTVNGTLTINAGKMKNPLFKAGKVPLIWDSDLNPEGFAAKIVSGKLFANAAVFAVEERSSSDDSLLYAAQGGVKLSLSERINLTAGAGYFAYTNTMGNEPFYNGSARGNTVDVNGDYVFDYKNAEVFAQLDTNVGEWPLQVFAHVTRNSEASSEDTAFAIGAKMGSAKDKGQMDFAWIFQDLETDAVIGTYADSDFGGGGTDSDGHMLKARYAFSKKIFLGGTLFVNDKDRVLAGGVDYNRIQVDLEYQFD